MDTHNLNFKDKIIGVGGKHPTPPQPPTFIKQKKAQSG